MTEQDGPFPKTSLPPSPRQIAGSAATPRPAQPAAPGLPPPTAPAQAAPAQAAPPHPASPQPASPAAAQSAAAQSAVFQAPAAQPAPNPAHPQVQHPTPTQGSRIAPVGVLFDQVVSALRGAIVGQDEALRGILIGLLSGGHVLLEGVPGTAKTLMVRALGRAVGLQFGRVQFTPDLMPSDVLGTRIFDLSAGEWNLTRGPIFTELLLADEINRAPAKTQSALLEAMQERQVSIDGEPHQLPTNFTVFATQNPVEQEGTYPLPEAQLDRFLLKIVVGYPSVEEEDRILEAAGSGLGVNDLLAAVPRVAGGEELEHARRLAGTVRVEREVRAYIRELVRATRQSTMVLMGAGPRAGIHLMVASRWSAALSGKEFATPDDVVRVLDSVIGHRLILAPEVELDGLSSRDVLDRITQSVPVPR